MWWSHTVDRPHCRLEEPYAGNHLASGKDTEKTWHNSLLVLTWVLTTSTSALISTERLCFLRISQTSYLGFCHFFDFCIGSGLYLCLEVSTNLKVGRQQFIISGITKSCVHGQFRQITCKTHPKPGREEAVCHVRRWGKSPLTDTSNWPNHPPRLFPNT